MSAPLQRPEFLLLGFVLVFAPFAFGTVEPWSLAVVDVAALLALAIALRRRAGAGRVRAAAAPGALPLLLFLGLLLLQLLPLPPPLLRLLSPAAHARWAAALGTAGPLPWLTLTLDPLATLREFCRFSACGAVYLLTVQLLARRERLRALTVALALFAGALAFEAIVQSVLAPTRLLFVRNAPGRYPFGPFVNRNHYANLMAMLAPVLLALFLGRRPAGEPRTLRARLVDLLARPESGLRILIGFAALLATASLVITLSRGATLAAVAALLVFGGFLVAQRLGGRRAAAVALFLYALTVVVGWFGWDKVAERFAGLRQNPEIVDTVRAGLWRDTLRMAADYPLLGAGVGTFPRLYPAYRTVPGPFDVAHAHNDHLELLAGGGAIGYGLFGWFVAAALLAAVRAVDRRQQSAARLLAYGAIAGCVAFLVHGASDFSLAIGANAVYFFFLLGLAVAAARTAAHAHGHLPAAPALLPERRYPAAVAPGAAALALAVGLFHGADLAGAAAMRRAEQELTRPGTAATTARLAALVAWAARLQPLDPHYPAALARIARLGGNAAAAIQLTQRSLRLLPLQAGSLTQLGDLFAAQGRTVDARRSFEAAIAADPTSGAPLERYGAWLLSQREVQPALQHLQAAMTLEPERSPAVFALLVLAGFDDRRIAAALPRNAQVLLRFAQYATTTGALPLAAEAYAAVLAIEPGNAVARNALLALRTSR